METKEKFIGILREKYSYLASEYGIRRIGLFGSYVKGTQNEQSDIDIVAEFEKPIGLKFIEFTAYLDQILGRKTDVLTLAGIEGIRIKSVAREIQESIVYV